MSDKPPKYRVTLWVRIRRRLMWLLFVPAFRFFFKVRVVGKENVPKEGGYLIAYNHISVFEPPFILAFWPKLPEAVAGHDVWSRPGQGIMVKLYHTIPVHRGEYDRAVLRTMMSVLAEGKPIMIAPEGGRSHEIGMRRAKAGVSFLMEMAKVPVLPIAIIGTKDDMMKRAFQLKRDPLELHIAKPYYVPKITGTGAERREMRQKVADEVMLRIAAMLPKEYHGVYAEMVKERKEEVDR